ncbi:small integral membrane protein 14 [Cylas formicarius]|uniref:small integral membrane protein 14 n=1 Tax=Cylas formicarius TaxID=197179 RepID=UPI002958CA92|nr:small integral membrane protein 14 [Cylas formicarius]
MGDDAGSFDPCACIWNHELAMRRLLNVLRNSQALCTDTECFETGATPPRTNPNNPDSLLILTVFFAAVLLLYMLRPRNQQIQQDVRKPSRNENNSNGPPPPAVN